MKIHNWSLLTAAVAALSMAMAGCSDAAKQPTPSNQLGSVSPALQRYGEQVVQGDVWNRPGLSPRDRSVVTVSALVTNNQTTELPLYVARALDTGVTPAELSEIITHLGFYSGWPNAMAAAAVTRNVFAEREIDTDELPQATPELLPLDEAAEAQRQSSNQQNYGAVAPGVLQYTTDVIFRDLWLRPGLSPRDRSLVTVSALVASGQVPQITYHLGRAMDNGLTQEQASEALTQLAFYAGWPKVFSALPVVKDVFASRPA
jgi:4-carboxymuconolactone decarboxylase